MCKEKILFMIDSLGGGGAEKVLCHILKNMNRNKFEIDVLVILKEGIYVSEIPEDVSFKYIFNSSESYNFFPSLLFYRFIRRVCLEMFKFFPFLLSHSIKLDKKYDCGISFCEGHNTPLLWLKSKNFNKTISWIHVDLTTHHTHLPLNKFRKEAKKLDRLIFVSEDAKSAFLKKFPEYEELDHQMKVIYNPIDISQITEQANSEETKLKAQEIKERFPGTIILGIGRLTRQKRFDRLIESHQILINKGIDSSLVILGEGPDERKLKKKCEIEDVSDTCFFEGFQSPYPYLFAADVFVMSSDYEGLPVVLCEAMIMNKLIVSTDITGPRELLEFGKYGLLTPKTKKGISEGIECMLSNEDVRLVFQNELKKANFIFGSSISQVEEELQS